MNQPITFSFSTSYVTIHIVKCSLHEEAINKRIETERWLSKQVLVIMHANTNIK